MNDDSDMKDATKQWTILTAIFLGPVVLFLMAYVLMAAFNERILASSYPKSLRVWVETLAPPDDLYMPSAEQQMERTASGWKVIIEPNHKYLGPYLVSLLSADGRFNRSSGVTYEMECWSEENTVRYSGAARGPLWTSDYETGESVNGAALNWYRLPDDFTLREEVHCRVAVQEDRVDGALSTPFIRIGRTTHK